MFRRVLVANRGEIAVRVIRACRELGVETVAIHSEPDRDALHVRLADQAFACGGAAVIDSYLRGDAIVEIARRAGADAVHPGYGFLAENGDFSDLCAASEIAFIGPRGDVIRAMGDKLTSRARMRDAGIAVVPGSDGPVSASDAASVAEQVGFPLMVKASAGGGGRGLRRVADAAGLAQALERVRGEAAASFGDDTLYFEKCIEAPRHIEVQFLADSTGRAVHLGERECSIQRRHQKLIEEAPANRVSPALRESLGAASLAAARAVDYCGAGTCEFLLDASGAFFFLEMNTRIQVEHPISEAITGIDIVAEMIRIAAGEPLRFDQADVGFRGHAIETRIYAEDPERGFMPSPGTIRDYREPGGFGVRVDSGVQAGSQVTTHYDPMLAKLITWGDDRPTAIARMRRALDEFAIDGIATSIPFHRRALLDPAFASGEYATDFVEQMAERTPDPASEADAFRIAALWTALRDPQNVERAFGVREARGAWETVRVLVEAGPDGPRFCRVDHAGEDLRLDVVPGASGRLSVLTESGRQFEASVAQRGKMLDVRLRDRAWRLEVRDAEATDE